MLRRVSLCVLLLGLLLSTTGCWFTTKVGGRCAYRNDLEIRGAQILPDSSLVLTVDMLCAEKFSMTSHAGRKRYRRYVVLDNEEREAALKNIHWHRGPPYVYAKVAPPGAEGCQMYPYHPRRIDAQPSDLPFSLKDAQPYNLRQDVVARPDADANQKSNGKKEVTYIPIRYHLSLPEKMRDYKPLGDNLFVLLLPPAYIVDVVTFPIQVCVVVYQIGKI